MVYEVTDIQYQTHSSPSGERQAVVFTVVYSIEETNFKNTAYLEFEASDTDESIAAAIEEHGRMLASKEKKDYTFARSGTIE